MQCKYKLSLKVQKYLNVPYFSVLKYFDNKIGFLKILLNLFSPNKKTLIKHFLKNYINSDSKWLYLLSYSQSVK